jgi:hypothetical protein
VSLALHFAFPDLNWSLLFLGEWWRRRNPQGSPLMANSGSRAQMCTSCTEWRCWERLGPRLLEEASEIWL